MLLESTDVDHLTGQDDDDDLADREDLKSSPGHSTRLRRKQLVEVRGNPSPPPKSLGVELLCCVLWTSKHLESFGTFKSAVVSPWHFLGVDTGLGYVSVHGHELSLVVCAQEGRDLSSECNQC